ncbi:ectoine hydroxylase [Magnetospirillum sulfuroxidans]|uniref:Ectoine hydroxylase n=1 Tax=Magnetospirillum sulfuroxidans TaxID=611300 RepID=A0ABS5IIE5_9PROT|nr:ectoine hydroxylase [Magnetospirillum sulfuroxidans]MBR9973473.1 ectoine hydroxylase [Magnetospirillum sulfuroxidans]
MSRDLYPSRQGNQSAIIDRVDPVVYAGGSGPLSAEEIAFFDQNGYLFLPCFFSPEETKAFQGEMRQIRDSLHGSTRDDVIVEPGTQEVRSVFQVHQSGDTLKRLSQDDRIVDRIRQLLASDVYIHQSRVNYKPGFKGKEFNWHSDFETWHVEDGVPRMRMISCSVALTENNEFNGPLMVSPGSQRHYVCCVGDTPQDHFRQSLAAQELGVPDPDALRWLVDRYGLIQAKGAAGSVLLFDCNVMHGSNGNISPFPRSNVFFVYNSVENIPQEPFSGHSPRPEFLGSRDFTSVAGGGGHH